MDKKEWKQRLDLNWCYNCWFAANIESRETLIGIMYLCRNCGISTRAGNDDCPRYFTDEEWNEYWQKNIQIKG